MASDLSNILQQEICATMSQLLSVDAKVSSKKPSKPANLPQNKYVKVDTKFDFKALSTYWSFYFPSEVACKFEFLMLGGMGENKSSVDNEVEDAVSEIVANMCGSISTSVNAQNFADLGNVKFESKGHLIVDGDSLGEAVNLFEFWFTLAGEEISFFISFDAPILSFFTSITGVDEKDVKIEEHIVPKKQATSDTNASLVGAIGQDGVENLKVLFDIKLRVSVRLGTKIMLLKDVLKWDIGEIIELEQMVNEPLDILVNGVKVGVGEAVVVEGKFGLKVRSIGTDKLKLVL